MMDDHFVCAKALSRYLVLQNSMTTNLPSRGRWPHLICVGKFTRSQLSHNIEKFSFPKIMGKNIDQAIHFMDLNLVLERPIK